MQSSGASRQLISIYQTAHVLIAGVLIFPGTAIYVVIIGTRVSHLALHIRFPVMIMIILFLGLTSGSYIVRLSHATYDKRLTALQRLNLRALSKLGCAVSPPSSPLQKGNRRGGVICYQMIARRTRGTSSGVYPV